ncbi:hypothetical protein GCM10022224_085590 [Nonomuraea antimicrobica]|uniref:Uncharacterized protein n=1 Tax=Nonomuraea antimicrobica TaxID=561173 RepID=A0ABP7DNQ7_9ACTN
MHRRAHLIAAALAAASIVPIAAPGGTTTGLVDRVHNVRDAVIEAGSRFHGLAEILTGVSVHSTLPL